MPNINLQEATSRYLMEGSPLVKKWGTKLTEVNSILKEEGQRPMNLEKQVALAKVLENTQNRINYELRESTQNTMVGPYKRYALDIISSMIPNLIAFDLVNVQPIENKMGIINYVKYTAGSNKNPQQVGSELASTFNFTGADVAGKEYYTAQTVQDEPIVFTTEGNVITFSLPWHPIIAGNVKLSIGSVSDIMDNPGEKDPHTNMVVEGTLTGTGVTGTINYMSGVGTLTLPGAPAPEDMLIGSWVFNNEYAPVDVPELNLSIESIPVIARSRKLKALWSFDAAYEMQKEYGQDLNGLLAAQAAAEIAHEIDVEIVNDLYAGAFTKGYTWDATVPVGVAQANHFESLKTTFNKASNKIFQDTKRAMGNFVVVGTNVATVIESSLSFQGNTDNSNVIGPYLMGVWGGYKVYKDPFLRPDQFVVGYKGSSLFDAGYCYAPYMPLATTQMLMLADFQGQQGWATSYGKKMLNNKMYVSGTISGLV